jgi:iron complex transport system substrate-binding protein
LVGDIWYSPAGESYNAILFKDANSSYVYQNSRGTGSIEKSFEQTLQDNKMTDFWFNPGVVSKKELLDFQPKFIHFNAVKNNKVYSYSYSGNQFWERSGVEPHHVLSDLIHILHPEIKNKRKINFYKQLK